MSIKQAIEALEKLHDVIYAHNKGGAFWGDNDIPMVRAMTDALAAIAALRSMPAEPVATIRYERGTPGKENDMPKVVSCNWLPDGVYSVYATPEVTEAVRMSEAEINEAMRLAAMYAMKRVLFYRVRQGASFSTPWKAKQAVDGARADLRAFLQTVSTRHTTEGEK